MNRLERYRIPRIMAREHRYLDLGLSSDEWRSMNARQQAVHERWRRWYRKRRALRELLAGGTPSRLPFPPDPSPPSQQLGSGDVGAGARKPLDLKGLNHAGDSNSRKPGVEKGLNRDGVPWYSKPLDLKGVPSGKKSGAPAKKKSKGKK